MRMLNFQIDFRDKDGGLFDIIFSDPELLSLKGSMKEPEFPKAVETTETTKPRFVQSEFLEPSVILPG